MARAHPRGIMASSSSLSVCVVLGLASVANAGHICNYGIHYFMEHSMKCPTCHERLKKLPTRSQQGSLSPDFDEESQRQEVLEACENEVETLGCNLFDFARGKPFGNFHDQQVHWPGGAWDLENFEYTEHDNVPGHDTCLMWSNCNNKAEDPFGSKCYGTTHAEFRMPDYCSRAITSELSTVYNGLERTTALSAGAKVLLANAGTSSCWWTRNLRGKKNVIDSIFDPVHSAKACWNHVNDWKLMYCAKYYECTCPKGLSPAECSMHQESVGCCKAKYQEFLDSKYNVYKGYPLRKMCRESFSDMSGLQKRWCQYNPDYMNTTKPDSGKEKAADMRGIY